jgi:DNA-binding NtrC family response regulator
VIIDDDTEHLKMLREVLDQDGLQILTADDSEGGLELVLNTRPEIALVDLVMPKLSGMELLERIAEALPETDVILMTGHYSTESAVEAIQKGACDYFEKPLSIGKVQHRIRNLLEQMWNKRHRLELERQMLDTCQFEGIVARSPLMLQMFAHIRRIAPHFRTVLLRGATGTGKELVARSLHRLSPADSRLLAVCNCSAIVETLFESELFGHVKGAFTGAIRDKLGLFEYAHGGTVFLDEIGDMPLTAQAKILRVIENQEIQPVGSPAVRKVDVRIILATHRDLKRLVKEGLFREDLYYRLSAVEVKIPRLAERREDLPLLIRHFLERCAKAFDQPVHRLTPRAEALLTRYSWPGNVRELENALKMACMIADGGKIDVRDLPSALVVGASSTPETNEELLSLEALEHRHILRVLDRLGDNKARAAEVLGIGRTTLYRVLGTIKAGKQKAPQPPIHRVNEQRLWQRAQVSCPTWIQTETETTKGRTVDLSLGGMLVQTPVTYSEGTLVSLRVQLISDHFPVRALGRVLRTLAYSKMAIQFDQLEVIEHAKLQGFLRLSSLRNVRRMSGKTVQSPRERFEAPEHTHRPEAPSARLPGK